MEVLDKEIKKTFQDVMNHHPFITTSLAFASCKNQRRRNRGKDAKEMKERKKKKLIIFQERLVESSRSNVVSK